MWENLIQIDFNVWMKTCSQNFKWRTYKLQRSKIVTLAITIQDDQ
jgi:hypothetical protein